MGRTIHYTTCQLLCGMYNTHMLCGALRRCLLACTTTMRHHPVVIFGEIATSMQCIFPLPSFNSQILVLKHYIHTSLYTHTHTLSTHTTHTHYSPSTTTTPLTCSVTMLQRNTRAPPLAISVAPAPHPRTQLPPPLHLHADWTPVLLGVQKEAPGHMQGPGACASRDAALQVDVTSVVGVGVFMIMMMMMLMMLFLMCKVGCWSLQ